MAVVQEMYIGHTHIYIHDDCCVKTQEEVQAILDRVSAIVSRAVIENAAKEAKASHEQQEQTK